MENGYHVKYRLLSWHQEVEDLLGNTVIAERTAMHGQYISTDPMPEDPEDRVPNAIYDVPEKEIERLKQLPDYPFFTEDEEAAFAAGITDYTGAQYGETTISGDTATSLAEPALGPDGVGAQLSGGHPLSFEEMNSQQLSEWMLAEEPDTNKLIELAYGNPLMIGNIMDAAGLADRDDREELAAGLAAVAGAGGSGALPVDSGEGEGMQGHGTGEGAAADSEPEGAEAPGANASTDEWTSFFEAQGLSTTDEDGNAKKRDAMVEEWNERDSA
jgi:hypothetical protein